MSKVKIDCTCDICESRKAKYDAKIVDHHAWAYMCPTCYDIYGSKIKGLFTIIDDSDEVDSNN